MKRGKYEAPRTSKPGRASKLLALLLSLVLVTGCVIGGTLAWLLDATEPVTNTFTVGDIALTLKESPYNAATDTYSTPAENVSNSYPLLPGNSYKKDPVVTVTANSEDCWLFVKVQETNNPADYLSYTLNLTGWKTLEGQDGVYYREVTKSASDQSWRLLVDDAIAVKNTVVKAGTDTTGTSNVAMPAANAQPQLTFAAYAVQKANRTVAEAWSLVSGS